MGLVFLLLGTLLMGVSFDLQYHNQQFADSFVGRQLKEYGGYEYGLLVYEQASFFGNKTVSWVREHGPVYVDKTATFLKPYAQLGRDLSFIAFNVSKRVAYNVTTYFNEYYPVADYWLVYYLGFCLLPGPISGVVQGHSLIVHLSSILPKRNKARENLPVVRDSINSALAATKDGAAAAYEAAKTKSGHAAEYLRENVFVGSMSPENLQKMSAQALDKTQGYAANTWSWIVDKVQTLSEDTK